MQFTHLGLSANIVIRQLSTGSLPSSSEAKPRTKSCQDGRHGNADAKADAELLANVFAAVVVWIGHGTSIRSNPHRRRLLHDNCAPCQ
jgi:hypothetical protein